MTLYNYCSEMQMLCARVDKILSVLKDEPLAFFYRVSEDGYFRQIEQMSAKKANEELPVSFSNRLCSFKKWVSKKEEEAARLQKLEAETCRQ